MKNVRLLVSYDTNYGTRQLSVTSVVFDGTGGISKVEDVHSIFVKIRPFVEPRHFLYH